MEEVYQHLTNDIVTKLQVGDMLPPEAEIASSLEINRTTVARAMSILEAKGIVKRQRGRGTTLVNKPLEQQRDTLLILAPWPGQYQCGDGYYLPLIHAIQTAAMERGMMCTLASCHTSEDSPVDIGRIERVYDPERVFGTIVIDAYVTSHQPLRQFLLEHNVPCVWAGTGVSTFKQMNRVDVDNQQAAFDMTSHLIKLGCKSITFMAPSFNTRARTERLEGWKEALQAAGMAVDEQQIISVTPRGDLHVAGRECAGVAMARGLSPDAIVLSDYTLLSGVHEFASQVNYQPLQDLPIATFDCRLDQSPDLVACAQQPIEKLGREAVALLADLNSGRISGPAVRSLQVGMETADVRHSALAGAV